jgi:hypothetical protein
MKLKTFFTEHAIDAEVTEGLLSNRAPHAVAARLPIDQRHYVSHRSR